jgi:hypothetical protein
MTADSVSHTALTWLGARTALVRSMPKRWSTRAATRSARSVAPSAAPTTAFLLAAPMNVT